MDISKIIDALISAIDDFQYAWARRLERITDKLRSWKWEIERIQVKLGFREGKHGPYHEWMRFYSGKVKNQPPDLTAGEFNRGE